MVHGPANGRLNSLVHATYESDIVMIRLGQHEQTYCCQTAEHRWASTNESRLPGDTHISDYNGDICRIRLTCCKCASIVSPSSIPNFKRVMFCKEKAEMDDLLWPDGPLVSIVVLHKRIWMFLYKQNSETFKASRDSMWTWILLKSFLYTRVRTTEIAEGILITHFCSLEYLFKWRRGLHLYCTCCDGSWNATSVVGLVDVVYCITFRIGRLTLTLKFDYYVKFGLNIFCFCPHSSYRKC